MTEPTLTVEPMLRAVRASRVRGARRILTGESVLASNCDDIDHARDILALDADITDLNKQIEAAEKVIVAYDDRHHHQDESLRGLAPRRRAESQVELDAAYATYRERYPK